MKGLLDIFNSDEGRLGLGLLAAAGPSMQPMGLGQRLAQAQQYTAERQQADLQKQFMQAQMANYDSQIEARGLATVKDARQQAMLQQFMGGGQPQGAQPTQGGAPMQAPAGPMQGSAPQGQDGGLLAFARSLGIPEQAIQADMLFNGGKKIAELLAERSKPNWQNVNGNLVNTNAQGFAGGLQGGMSASADGKVTAWQPDGQGGLVVGAPKGAQETYSAFKGIDAGLSAAGKLNLRKNADGTESPVSELAENPVLQGLLGGGNKRSPFLEAVRYTESRGNVHAVSPKGARGDMQVMPGTSSAPGFGVAPARDDSHAERTRVGEQYLGKMQERYQDPTLAAIAYNWGPGNTDLWLKSGGDFRKLPKETQGYVAQVMTRTAVGGRGQPGQAEPQGGAPSYGMTNDQAAAAKAQEARAVDAAKADVVRETEGQKAGKRGNQMLLAVDRAVDLLSQGPTASGIGAAMDKSANFFGRSTKGADVASQLDTLSGWLTSNVPRMEGPQSDKDMLNYSVMAGAVGDRSKPVSQRMAAAKELRALQAKYAALNGTDNTGGATGGFDAAPAPSSGGGWKILGVK